jgi:UDP-N-acetylglucosamine enolpyruvyl transferase
MGAQIEGIGSNIYLIDGGRPLGGASYAIGPDHIDCLALYAQNEARA